MPDENKRERSSSRTPPGSRKNSDDDIAGLIAGVQASLSTQIETQLKTTTDSIKTLLAKRCEKIEKAHDDLKKTVETQGDKIEKTEKDQQSIKDKVTELETN